MAGTVRDILINLLGRETVSTAAKKAAGGVDDLGDSMKATAGDAKRLDREIEQAERALRDLAVQYARTDDAAQRMDLAKAMRRQQAEVRRLTKAKDLLPDPDEAGRSFGARFVARLGPMIASAPLGPAGAAAGATVAAAMAPVIGGAITTALLGGAGGAGIAGGIALAAQDSRVQDAGRQLAEAVLGDVEESAGTFVAPVIKGIGLVRDAWGEVSDEVDDVFGSASEYVVPLARGIAGAVREIAPGFRDAAAAARPVVREISYGIPRIGRALGDMLSGASDDADEAAASVRGIFIALEGSIRMASALTSIFSDMVGPVIMLGQVMAGYYDIIVGWIPGIGQLTDSWVSNWDEMDAAMKGAGQSGGQVGVEILDGLRKAAEGAANATTEVKSFTSALRELRDQTTTALDAEIQFERSLDETAAAAKRASGGLDLGTEAGRKNMEQLRALHRDTVAYAQAVKERTGSEDQAAAVTERGRQAFIRNAIAMGESRKRAEELANQLFGIPNITRKVDVDTDEAGRKIRWLKTQISGIDRRIFIKAEFDLINNADVAMAMRLGRLSSGGPVVGSGPKGVDSQPYLLAPGEHVLTAAEVDAAGGHAGVEQLRAQLRGERSAAVPAAVGANTGGGTATAARRVMEHRIVIEGTGLLAGLRKEIRILGGDVQVALGDS